MKRIDYLDIAKGIAIFLVVLGHVVLAFDTPFWRLAIYSFHMPLFFLVSGTVAKCRGDFGGKGVAAFVGKNMMAIMVPYVLWAFIYLPFKFESVPWIFYGSWAALDKIGTSTALWYLPCLFCARMEFAVLDWLVGKAGWSRTWFFTVLAPVSFTVGFLLPRPAMGCPWGLDTSFIALGFLLLGSAAKDFLAANARGKLGGQIAVFAVAATMFICGTWLRRDVLDLVGMFSFQYGNLFWFFWNALSGSLTVLAFASLFARVKPEAFGGRLRTFLVWLGRNTIGIYLLHLPIVRFFVAPTLDKWGFSRMAFGWALVDAVIALAICCALMWVIERYVPVLFGRVGGVRKGSRAADVVSLLLGEDDYIAKLDEPAVRELLGTFRKNVLADGKVDFNETLLLTRAVGPLARQRGGAYREFVDLLERTRADGVITPDESREIAAALEKLTK